MYVCIYIYILFQIPSIYLYIIMIIYPFYHCKCHHKSWVSPAFQAFNLQGWPYRLQATPSVQPVGAPGQFQAEIGEVEVS